jgi:hypothetical protein
MHTYSFIVSFSKANTFSITINEDSKRDAVIRMQEMCDGATFKMIDNSED